MPFITSNIDHQFSIALTAHSKVHPSEIGDKPDKPYDETVSVEPLAGILTTPFDDISGPDGMNEHQPQSNLTGKGMNIKQVKGVI